MTLGIIITVFVFLIWNCATTFGISALLIWLLSLVGVLTFNWLYVAILTVTIVILRSIFSVIIKKGD